MLFGKRKRDHAKVPRQVYDKVEDTQHSADPTEIYRKYFESQFAPLPNIAISNGANPEVKSYSNNVQSDTDESEFEGLSKTDSEPQVTVVEHNGFNFDENVIDGLGNTTFMSFKPPLSTGLSKGAKKAPVQVEEDSKSDALNLKHDLDLQRLLKESHLLEKGSKTVTPLRNTSIDLRLQSLGAKSSILEQQKMPMSHKRGIKMKAAHKESSRRINAQENGVVLERASKVAKQSSRQRERGVDGPGIGKFKHGTLTLTRKDIAFIQGPVMKQRKGGRR